MMESFIKKYLKHGLISPGYQKLSFTLGTRVYRADVLADGAIFDENHDRFDDVTDWVTKCINSVISNPGQILNIVKYGDTPLSTFEQLSIGAESKDDLTRDDSNINELNKEGKNRYIAHLHSSFQYFLAGVQTGIFQPGQNILKFNTNNLTLFGSLTKSGHMYDEHNNYYDNPFDWVDCIMKQYNLDIKTINSWNNLYYNNKPLCEYEDLILKLLPSTTTSFKSGFNPKFTLPSKNLIFFRQLQQQQQQQLNTQFQYMPDSPSIKEENDQIKDSSPPSDQSDQSDHSIGVNHTSDYIPPLPLDDSHLPELKDDLPYLVNSHILQPGVDILELRHNGESFRASLMKNGKIRDGSGMKFKNLQSWGDSVVVLDLVKLIDSVFYNSAPIKDYMK